MIQTIKKRSGFVEIGKDGVSVKTKSVVVLCLQSVSDKVGYTASKRVGCAAQRNKAKRRLRHLVMEFEDIIKGGFSFVFIANFKTHSIDFSVLKLDFKYAILKSKELLKYKTFHNLVNIHLGNSN